jgi:hypothetical protein
VDFNQEFDGIVFPESDLATPIATADAELLDILCNHLDMMLAAIAIWKAAPGNSACIPGPCNALWPNTK